MAEDQSEAISAQIHAELLAWLEDTNATAASPEDSIDLVTGAICGLAEFIWRHRKPGATPESLAAGIAHAARAALVQMPALDGGQS